MTAGDIFPLRLWINAGRFEARRREMEGRLAEGGLDAERFAAFPDIGPVQKGGMDSSFPAEPGPSESYLKSLAFRLALREAGRRKAPAALLISDQAKLHPNFRALLDSIDLPEDWGLFYPGCIHIERPLWVGERLVRCTNALAPPALAVRAPYYRRVMELLARQPRADAGQGESWDVTLASLQSEVLVYAAWPNLMWEEPLPAEAGRQAYASFSKDGMQRDSLEAVAGLLDQALGLPERPRAAKLGLLFLTRGDVNHPEIWRDWISEASDRIAVFSHSKEPDKIRGGLLEGTAIGERFETTWGDISLVRASRALLLAAIEDETITHFVLLSESCVPVKPLPEILRRLELDPRPQFEFRTLAEATGKQAARVEGAPRIPRGCWRFTPQWWLLDRSAAILAAGGDYTEWFSGMMAPDEAYFATVLCMQGYPLDGGVVKNRVTWTRWEEGAGSPETWGALPLNRLESLLHSGAFFARKFPPEADIGRFGLHRSPHLLLSSK